VTWPTSVPILVFLSLSVLDLCPMYVADRQTSDAHHRLMPSTLGAGHNTADCPSPKPHPSNFYTYANCLQHLMGCQERQSGGNIMQENSSAAGAPPRTPLGELKALPRPPSWWGRRLAAPSPKPHPTPTPLSDLQASPLLLPLG